VKHAAALLQRPLLVYLQGQMRESISTRLAGAALASAQKMTADGAAGLSSVSGGFGSGFGGAGASLAEAAGLAVSAAGASRPISLPPRSLRSLSALQACVGYTPQLWQRAEEEFSRSLPRDALKAARAQLQEAEAVQGAFQASLDSGAAQVSRHLLARLRFDVLASAGYLLHTEAAFAAAEGDSFVSGLVDEVSSLMRPLAHALVDQAREAVLQQLVQGVAERLEALLTSKKFDQLGALHFDRELRALTKRLGELSSKGVREKLTRLTQISTLLNLETESDAVELWDPSTWRLSAAEARQVLSLRVEFRKEAIAGLIFT